MLRSYFQVTTFDFNSLYHRFSSDYFIEFLKLEGEADEQVLIRDTSTNIGLDSRVLTRMASYKI